MRSLSSCFADCWSKLKPMKLICSFERRLTVIFISLAIKTKNIYQSPTDNLHAMTPLKVTCAIITIDGKILAVQRSRIMSLPMKWEFPGGKIEPAETEMECIQREIREELNIEIKLLDRLQPSVHRYPTFTIELIPYTAHYVSGQLQLKEHNRYVLLNRDELSTLDWAEADWPIVQEVMRL